MQTSYLPVLPCDSKKIYVLFSVHSILERDYTNGFECVMPKLERITVQIGEDWGRLLVAHNFDNVKISKCVRFTLS